MGDKETAFFMTAVFVEENFTCSLHLMAHFAMYYMPTDTGTTLAYVSNVLGLL